MREATSPGAREGIIVALRTPSFVRQMRSTWLSAGDSPMELQNLAPLAGGGHSQSPRARRSPYTLMAFGAALGQDKRRLDGHLQVSPRSVKGRVQTTSLLTPPARRAHGLRSRSGLPPIPVPRS